MRNPDRIEPGLRHPSVPETSRKSSHIPRWLRVPAFTGRLFLATLTVAPGAVVVADALSQIQNPSIVYAELVSCPGVAITVPGQHSEIQPGNLDSSAPKRKWFNPIYNQGEANAARNWRGIDPWAPIAFDNIDPNAAELKTFGNLGHFVIRGVNGGKVALGFWQEAEHQDETKMKPDGSLDKSHKNQYTFVGLGPNQPIGLFDPDNGTLLNTWPDGSSINYTANSRGIAVFEVPAGEVRWGICFNMPGQATGEQVTEVQVFRGPNDHPELKGANPLPSAVVKQGMPTQTSITPEATATPRPIVVLPTATATEVSIQPQVDTATEKPIAALTAQVAQGITPTPTPGTTIPEIRPTPFVSEALPNTPQGYPIWQWVLGGGLAGIAVSRLYRRLRG